MPNLKIQVTNAAHDGYRRAGLRFHKGKNTLDSDAITEAQLAMLEADPHLAVLVAADKATGADGLNPEKKDAGSKKNRGLDAGGVPGGLSNALSGVALNTEGQQDYPVPTKFDALVKAISQLDPSSNEHFTADGKPKTDALEALVNDKVSAKERDDAWAVASKPGNEPGNEPSDSE